MTDYMASADRALLQRHGLDDFEALWALELDAVDEPNTGRGGWSSVYRLELEGKGYYLKRQSDYLTRSLHKPFGEPTFAREFAISFAIRSCTFLHWRQCSTVSASKVASTGPC